jgi:segregation and condensation protein A
MIVRKIGSENIGFLKKIVSDLEPIDAIRCFFAILFLARDEKVELEQVDEDIKITLVKENLTS